MRLVSFQALHTTVSYCLLGLTGSSALDTVPSGREEWSPAGPSAPCPGNTLLPRAPGGISLLPGYWWPLVLRSKGLGWHLCGCKDVTHPCW